jgi:hypothetical protein
MGGEAKRRQQAAEREGCVYEIERDLQGGRDAHPTEEHEADPEVSEPEEDRERGEVDE